MSLNIRQNDFLDSLRKKCSDLSKVVHEVTRLSEMFGDEFAAGKSNEISTEDLLAYGITQYKLTMFSNAITQLNNYWNGSAVTAQDNKKYIQNCMNGL